MKAFPRAQPWPAVLAGLLAFAPGAAEAGWEPGALHRDRITVTYVAPEPCCGSGIVAVYVKIEGDSAGDGPRTYLLPFMERGQKSPKAGNRCSLSYHIYDVNGHISGESASILPDARVISTFRCGKGRARRPGD